MKRILLVIGLVVIATSLIVYQSQKTKLEVTLVKSKESMPSIVPSVSPTPTPTPIKLSRSELTVPFTSQSPFAQWSDPRQQDACEEASALMAMKWVRNLSIKDKQSALDEIFDIVNFESKNYGNFHDTSAKDTVERIFKGYYKYNNAKAIEVNSYDDIIDQLQNGNLAITPMNGQDLNNPHFTGRGPERHMVVIIGFDRGTQEFITNDPGIREGQNYRYNFDLFFNAIRDYLTGDHVLIEKTQKNMIVVTK